MTTIYLAQGHIPAMKIAFCEAFDNYQAAIGFVKMQFPVAIDDKVIATYVLAIPYHQYAGLTQ